MSKKQDKKAQRIKKLFEDTNTSSRVQWERVNQKGYDFAHDNQISAEEKAILEDQGMPTFTINRIIPVVEMLNFYATANRPRWQAVGAEGTDTDVAAVFSDISDYVWYNSNGESLFANVINDAVTKSVGYMLVTVDKDADQGMGEVIIQQPEPFDIYVDHKSRDILFRDADYIMIRKVLPKSHLIKQFPEKKRLILNASTSETYDYSYTEKAFDKDQKDFHYKDITKDRMMEDKEQDSPIEFYEVYEKEKIAWMNVFYRIPPNEQAMKSIATNARHHISELKAELEVILKEKENVLLEQLEAGEILKERFELEMKKMTTQMTKQIEDARMSIQHKMQEEQSKTANKVITEKEFKLLIENKSFANTIIDAIKFFKTRIKLTCVIGDKTLYEKYLPLEDYPLVPFHYKWTGTPFPISAVSPLIGKQRELNKAHQLMVHNASLGSSLRWMYEEGSVDTDYWERFASAPGALLPIRQGFTPPTPVTPFQLNNAFFGLVQQGKGDMEYLAGIYSAMQGDTNASTDMPYRGMLAMDEYGTRRIKYWLRTSIEPGLKQLGEVVKQMTQHVYTAHKVFRIVEPSGINPEKQVEINIPVYNSFGHVINKHNDYATAKFDIRVVAGSTLPVNRWAYLEELKELMKMGVVDDVAVLAETDIRNKEKIIQRKSLYSQLQGQIKNLEESVQDKEGAIETLSRQLVQAGIKDKIRQGEMEDNKKRVQTEAARHKEMNVTKVQQTNERNALKQESSFHKRKADTALREAQEALKKNALENKPEK
tara:strand:+ start:857 stop:3163 length:2307 start_codon:yes stop_codon:yes gene_type:complete